MRIRWSRASRDRETASGVEDSAALNHDRLRLFRYTYEFRDDIAFIVMRLH